MFLGSPCGTVCLTVWFKSDIVWWRRNEQEAVEWCPCSWSWKYDLGNDKDYVSGIYFTLSESVFTCFREVPYDHTNFLHFDRQTPPAPRYDHSAAIQGERYLLIFGGCSHSIFFNDLHLLDMQTVSKYYFPSFSLLV